MEIPSPIVLIDTSEGEFKLTYMNTRMRLFKDTGLDHVEYRTEQSKLKGLLVSRVIMDTLFELEFPMTYDPYPDEETIEWFIKLEKLNFEDEINNL